MPSPLRIAFGCALLGAFGCSAGAVRPVVLPRTETHDLVSSANGHRYAIEVALPRSYSEGMARFGVLVLLDADYSFALARNIVEHLADRKGLPELIVVGVGYPANDYPRTYQLNRTRDYTPVYSAEGYPDHVQDVSGGAPGFQRFLAEELLPWIDSHYRTNAGERALVGHSYGALFGAWTLMTRPELFQRYLLVSPSFWYADRSLFALEERLGADHFKAPVKVVVAVGGEEPERMKTGLTEFVARMKRREEPGKLSVVGRVFDGENHDSIFPGALTWGLRALWPGDPHRG